MLIRKIYITVCKNGFPSETMPLSHSGGGRTIQVGTFNAEENNRELVLSDYPNVDDLNRRVSPLGVYAHVTSFELSESNNILTIQQLRGNIQKTISLSTTDNLDIEIPTENDPIRMHIAVGEREAGDPRAGDGNK